MRALDDGSLRAEALVASLRERVRMDLRVVSLEALQQGAGGPWDAAEVVIHATSLGVAWDAPPRFWDHYADPDDPPPPAAGGGRC